MGLLIIIIIIIIIIKLCYCEYKYAHDQHDDLYFLLDLQTYFLAADTVELALYVNQF